MVFGDVEGKGMSVEGTGEVVSEGEEIDFGIFPAVELEGEGIVEKEVVVLDTLVVAPDAGGMK